MAYSSDLRKRVLDFIEQGGSKSEASRLYRIGIAKIFRWTAQPKNYTAGKPGPKSGHRLNRDDLYLAIKEKPDSLQRELAERFGVSIGAIAYALKEMGLTRKKRHSTTRKA